MSERGISEFCILWDSGLVNSLNQSVLFLGVQQLRGPDAPPYILLRSGIFCDKYPPFLNEKANFFLMGNMSKWPRPCAARYVSPRNPELLFDDEAEHDVNVTHLIENAARFVDAGVVDEAEFIVGYAVAYGAFANDDETARWPLLEEKERFTLRDGRLVAVAVSAGNGTMTYFRRGNLGMKAFQHMLEGWVQEAVELCRRCRTLVVPQYYYQKKMILTTAGYCTCMCGSLQLLLPLYCGEHTVKLALTMQWVPDGNGGYWYSLRTVLPCDWARSNARLLSCPQVQWLNA